jgi:DNA-binding winged helix-turn-helix (wHTH) protein/TolB-like protein
VALEPQPARALARLLSRADDLVTRDDLRGHLWGDDTHVDFDRGLAYCIGQLRAAIGDNADNPRFIQTLPRRGFRFIAPVETVDPDRTTREPVVAPSARSPRGHPRAMAAAIAFAVTLGAGATWMVTRARPSPRPIVAVAVFDNESGDASYARTIAALSDAIVERLTALGPERIGVNGNAVVLRQPRGARDQKAVVRDTRASYLVSGQLQTKDGRLSLLMQLIRLDDGTHVWVQRLSRPSGDTLEALDQDAARLIEAAVRQVVLKDTPRTS